jgi:hypothetical protein
MPKYKTIDDLEKAIVEYTEQFCAEVWPSLKDTPEVREFNHIFKVYRDAYNNPPDGVIGVGKITYAEQKMIEAQEGVDYDATI